MRYSAFVSISDLKMSTTRMCLNEISLLDKIIVQLQFINDGGISSCCPNHVRIHFVNACQHTARDVRSN